MKEQHERITHLQSRMVTTPYVRDIDVTTTQWYELPPAAVLPEQFYDSASEGRHESGAVALIRAMLDDAIACYQYQGNTGNKRNQRLAKEAEAWLFSDEVQWLFAFVNVCAALGIEPDYIRRGLQHWRRVSLGKDRPKRRLTNMVRHALPIAA